MATPQQTAASNALANYNQRANLWRGQQQRRAQMDPRARTTMGGMEQPWVAQQEAVERANLGAGRPAGGTPGFGDAAGNRARGMGLTEGRAQQILDDPRYGTALDTVQSAATGESLPFSDAAVTRMQGRFGDQVGAQQTAAQNALRAQMASAGLTGSDPAAQALQRDITEQGALQRQGNYRDLLIQQAITNFQAQQAAANQLAGMRGQQYALGNPLAQQAADYYMRTFAEPETRVTEQYQQPTFGVPSPSPVQTAPAPGGTDQELLGVFNAMFGDQQAVPSSEYTPYSGGATGPVEATPVDVGNSFNLNQMMNEELGLGLPTTAEQANYGIPGPGTADQPVYQLPDIFRTGIA